MKKRFFYLFPLFILLLSVVCSCKDDNNEPTPPEPSPEITIPSSENLNPVLSQEGGTVSISFTATADWTASLVNTRAESWIAVTPSSGSKGKNEITITTTANESYDERNATVVLKCGSDSKNIVVTQKQKDALTVTSSKYEVASKGGNISVEVKANINFEVEARADWIKQQTEKTRALTTSNLNFTIEPNETGDKREGEIIIKSGELSETIKVYQGFEDFITLTKKDFTIPEEGGNVDIEIKSTLDYEVKMLSDIDWITEIQSRAVSTHTHHYTISPNETYDSREAKIVFYNPKDENVADTVSIYQMYKGAILIARNEYQFGIDGGTLNLAVQTNLEFDVEVSDTWIQQVQPTRALTEYNLSFAISKNTDNENIDNDTYDILGSLSLLDFGYLRFDYDPKNEKGDIHPLHHLDINYSKYGTFKIKLPNRITMQHFEDIFDKEKPCISMFVKYLSDLQGKRNKGKNRNMKRNR